MKQVTLITGHYIGSKRKAGFHHLANAYLKMGWKVLFLTAPISHFSELKKDYRFEYNINNEKNQLTNQREREFSYIHYTPFHPFSLRYQALDFFSWPFLKCYQYFSLGDSEAFISNSDLIIFESTPALILFDKIKRIAPNAKFIYRVSDDIRLLKLHRGLIRYEEKNANQFDLVSVPAQYIYNVQENFVDQKRLSLDFHGIDKALFDQAIESPYKPNQINIVFVGNSHFDQSFLEIATTEFEHYIFHIIGPITGKQKNNIIYYGEMPFKDTIPFIRFADIGLQIRAYFPGIESLTDSLKMIQYTYCGLPIICPDYIKSKRSNCHFYKANDKESIVSAIEQALSQPKEDIAADPNIRTWSELALHLAETVDETAIRAPTTKTA